MASKSTESVLHFEEVLRRSAEMHGGIKSDRRTRTAMHAHGRASEGRVVGNLAASGYSAGVGDIRMDHVQHLVIEVWTESFHQLDLLTREQWRARGSFQFQPGFCIVNGQWIFDPQGIDRLDGFAQTDRAAGIELAGAMHGNVDIVPEGFAQTGIALGRLAEFRAIQCRGERPARSYAPATPA